MAQKKGAVKRFFLTIVLLTLLAIVFILMGGGKMLKSAGNWLSGVGKEAETVKRQMEEKAATTGKTVEKVIQTVKPDENKGGKK